MNPYPEFINEKHIFIYAVCGRSSSTALQRILNSSNEVCIWGEPWGVDHLFLKFIHDLKASAQSFERKPKEHMEIFRESFETGVHDRFYPNAFRDLSPALDLVISAFTELIKPLGTIRRMGYKEIKASDPLILETLIRLFPNSKIIFLFRDPLRQWTSIRDSKSFPISDDVHKFISAYLTRADLYINTSRQFQHNCVFVENSQLYHHAEVERLITLLDLSGYDKTLISKIVSTSNRNPLTENERALITGGIGKKYNELKQLRF